MLKQHELLEGYPNIDGKPFTIVKEIKQKFNTEKLLNKEIFEYNGWHCSLMPDNKRYICSKLGHYKIVNNKEEL